MVIAAAVSIVAHNGNLVAIVTPILDASETRSAQLACLHEFRSSSSSTLTLALDAQAFCLLRPPTTRHLQPCIGNAWPVPALYCY